MIKSSVLNVKSTLYSSLLSRLTAVKLSAKIKKKKFLQKWRKWRSFHFYSFFITPLSSAFVTFFILVGIPDIMFLSSSPDTQICIMYTCIYEKK